MMHLAMPKQNGSQKSSVHLDTKANEREVPAQFLCPTQGNSCDEFLEPRAKLFTTVKVISY
jgi:hypothetical protein